MDEEIAERRRKNDKEWEEVLSRLVRLEDSYSKVSLTVVRLETMVENFSNLVERFENILERTNSTLNGLNLTIVKINGRVVENTEDIDELQKGISSVRDKVRLVDEKGKIDFVKLISENLGKFIFGGGAIAAIAFWVDHLIDTYLKSK